MEAIKRVLGAGKIYFDPEDANGNLTGERYMGNTPGFAMPVSSESVESFSSDGPTAEREALAVTRVTRNVSLQCNQINRDNLALFVIGDAAELTQNNTPVVDEAIDGVLQGRYYQLGKPITPTGVRGVTSVTITDDAGTPTQFDVDVDYTLDAAMARIFVVEGGNITDGTNLRADYTPDSNTRDQVTASDVKAAYGALHYIADNTEGPNNDVYIPRVILRPDGEIAWKSRDTFISLGFQMEALKRGTLAQVYIDGRPA